MDEHLTYAVLLLGWALPPIVLQWLAGWRWLGRHWLVWFAGILLPTVWLVLADSTALGIVWTIAPDKATGLFVGNVPVEEVLFFILTNTLVVQSFLLIYHARELANDWRTRFSRLGSFLNKKPHGLGS